MYCRSSSPTPDERIANVLQKLLARPEHSDAVLCFMSPGGYLLRGGGQCRSSTPTFFYLETFLSPTVYFPQYSAVQYTRSQEVSVRQPTKSLSSMWMNHYYAIVEKSSKGFGDIMKLKIARLHLVLSTVTHWQSFHH